MPIFKKKKAMERKEIGREGKGGKKILEAQ